MSKSRESDNKRLRTTMTAWLGKTAQSSEEAMETEDREFELYI